MLKCLYILLLSGLTYGYIPPPPKLNGTKPLPPVKYNKNVNHSHPQGQYGGCYGGIYNYPSDWPNSYYYQRYCQTYHGLAVVTDGIAPDAALERTAWTLDNMMATMEPYVAQKLVESGFRQAVMGRYPYETVTSLPEFQDQDASFWNNRRGCGATPWVTVG